MIILKQKNYFLDNEGNVTGYGAIPNISEILLGNVVNNTGYTIRELQDAWRFMMEAWKSGSVTNDKWLGEFTQEKYDAAMKTLPSSGQTIKTSTS